MPSNCVGFSSSPHLSGEVASLSLPARYVEIEQIGLGASCLVLKARDTFLDRSVAIKYMRPEINDFTSLRRFQQEAKVMSSFSLKHLPTVLDFGLSRSGRPYMVMELVNGTSLKEIIEQRGRLELSLVLEISIQVLSALIHAHDRGIIHRDLKAHNILVSRLDDRTPMVKVVDFGLASGTDQRRLGVTATGAALGTPLYMSPEQAQGRAADERSDIYSLGCVIFEMLTGRTPFQSKSITETVDAHVRTPAPSLGSYIRISEHSLLEMEAILARMLDKLPSNRHQRALDLQSELIGLQESMNNAKSKPWKRFLETVAELDQKYAVGEIDCKTEDSGPIESWSETNAGSDAGDRAVDPVAACPAGLHSPLVALGLCGRDLFRSNRGIALILLVVALVLALLLSLTGKEAYSIAFENSKPVAEFDKDAYDLTAWSDLGDSDLVSHDQKIQEELRKNLQEDEFLPADIMAGMSDQARAAEVAQRNSKASWEYIYRGKFHVAGADFWALPSMRDDDCVLIRRMPQVKNINLISANMTGSGLEDLDGLPIEKLDVRSQKLSHRAFSAIAKLSSLKTLKLDYVLHFNDRELATLEHMQSLRTLTVRGNHLSKKTQVELTRFSHLERLALDYATGVDDSTLELLAGMPHLKHLSLAGLAGRISGAAVSEFRRKRPDVNVRS